MQDSATRGLQRCLQMVSAFEWSYLLTSLGKGQDEQIELFGLHV
jgi:hypothetical protein